MEEPVEKHNQITSTVGQDIDQNETQEEEKIVEKPHERIKEKLLNNSNAKETGDVTTSKKYEICSPETKTAEVELGKSNSKVNFEGYKLEEDIGHRNNADETLIDDNINESPNSSTEMSQKYYGAMNEQKHEEYRSQRDSSKAANGEVRVQQKASNSNLQDPGTRPSTNYRKLDFTSHIVQKFRIIRNNATKQKLITGSHYNGVWQDALQCMDGYGIYTYPDGSEYRGYFSRGYFNGYGTLHLATPYNFSFKGTFIAGLIHEIEDMWFDDGLQVNASFAGWSADFSNWKYCCPKDRRYAAEQTEGLPAVGPYSFLTNKRPVRELGKTYFDIEEGFYNPSSGFIIGRPKPFTNISVPCKDQIEWIVKNCRHGCAINQESPAAVYHNIIRNNLESELELAEHDPSCNYGQELYRKRYFANLCKDQLRDRKLKATEDLVDGRFHDSSSTDTTLSDRSLSVDVQEYLETGRQFANMKIGRDLERDQLSLMSQPFKRDSARSSNISYGRKSK